MIAGLGVRFRAATMGPFDLAEELRSAIQVVCAKLTTANAPAACSMSRYADKHAWASSRTLLVTSVRDFDLHYN